MPNKFDDIHNELMTAIDKKLEKFISLLKRELNIDLDKLSAEDLKKIRRSLSRLVKKTGLDSLGIEIEEFFILVEKESTRMLASSTKISIEELNKKIIDYAETIAETGLEKDIDKITDDLKKTARKKLTVKNLKGMTKEQVGEDIESLFALPKARFETATRTAVMGYDRLVTTQKANFVGLNKFRWMGQLDSRTTDFCRARHNKIFTDAEAKQWRNGMKEPADVYGHGYNCRYRKVYIVE